MAAFPARFVAVLCGLGALSEVACSSSSSSSAPPADGGTDAAAEIPVDPLANWSCLGKVKVPAPVAATTPYDFQLVDPTNAKPVANATVRTCALADTTCASPIETMTTGETGIAAFTKLPTAGKGFEGYFEVKIGSETPILNFLGIPIWTKWPKRKERMRSRTAALARATIRCALRFR